MTAPKPRPGCPTCDAYQEMDRREAAAANPAAPCPLCGWEPTFLMPHNCTEYDLWERIRALEAELADQKKATQDWADAWEDLDAIKARVRELEAK